MSSSIYSNLVPNIYETSTNPEKWVSNLDQIAKLAGAKGAALLLLETLDVFHYSINFLTSNYNIAAMIEYQNRYSKYEQDAFTKLGLSEPMSLVKDDLFNTDREAAESRPDVVFLKENFGVLDRFGIRINTEKEYFNGMTFQYAASRGNVTDNEWKRIQPLFIHIKTAMDISRSFSILKARYNAILSVLNRVNMAYAISLSTGEVIVLNNYAKKTLDKKDGIRLSPDNKIQTTNSDLNVEIQSAILAASQTVSGINTHASKLIAIPCSGQNEPLLLEISPLRDATRELDGFLTGALIAIIDSEEQTSIDTNSLKELYGLTKAESIVANMMVSGKTNHEIADERNVSRETVKKQVESVLAKTMSTNRTDLVRRILSINIPII